METKIITNPNKFVKILVACGITIDLLGDVAWHWDVEEIEPHKYHCIGSHPVARRIDVIKGNIFV